MATRSGRSYQPRSSPRRSNDSTQVADLISPGSSHSGRRADSAPTSSPAPRTPARGSGDRSASPRQSSAQPVRSSRPASSSRVSDTSSSTPSYMRPTENSLRRSRATTSSDSGRRHHTDSSGVADALSPGSTASARNPRRSGSPSESASPSQRFSSSSSPTLRRRLDMDRAASDDSASTGRDPTVGRGSGSSATLPSHMRPTASSSARSSPRRSHMDSSQVQAALSDSSSTTTSAAPARRRAPSARVAARERRLLEELAGRTSEVSGSHTDNDVTHLFALPLSRGLDGRDYVSSDARTRINRDLEASRTQVSDLSEVLPPAAVSMRERATSTSRSMLRATSRNARDGYRTGEDLTYTETTGADFSGTRMPSDTPAPRSPRPSGSEALSNTRYEQAHAADFARTGQPGTTVWAPVQGNQVVDTFHERHAGRSVGGFTYRRDTYTSRETFSAAPTGDGRWDVASSVYRRRNEPSSHPDSSRSDSSRGRGSSSPTSPVRSSAGRDPMDSSQVRAALSPSTTTTTASPSRRTSSSSDQHRTPRPARGSDSSQMRSLLSPGSARSSASSARRTTPRATSSPSSTGSPTRGSDSSRMRSLLSPGSDRSSAASGRRADPTPSASPTSSTRPSTPRPSRRNNSAQVRNLLSPGSE